MRLGYKEGFSLVELMLSILMTSIILLGLITLFSYTSRSLRVTRARVAIQDQAKDSVNHISSYVQDSGSVVTWDGANEVLTVRKKTIDNVGASASAVSAVDAYVYWKKTDSSGTGHLYFADATSVDPGFNPRDDTSVIDTSKLTADKTHLLTDDVDTFECSIDKKLSDSTKEVLHVQLKLKDSVSEFNCEKDIVMRNQ